MANTKSGEMSVSEMASKGGFARWKGVPKDERKALARLWGRRGGLARWKKRRKRPVKAEK